MIAIWYNHVVYPSVQTPEYKNPAKYHLYTKYYTHGFVQQNMPNLSFVHKIIFPFEILKSKFLSFTLNINFKNNLGYILRDNM